MWGESSPHQIRGFYKISMVLQSNSDHDRNIIEGIFRYFSPAALSRKDTQK